MSLIAYQAVMTQAGSERLAEHRALAMVTARLVKARDDQFTGVPLIEALHANRRLWDIFATDCASVGNKLPEKLRAQVISVALFVSRHSSDVARKRGDINDLIEINRNIMGGLVAASTASA